MRFTQPGFLEAAIAAHFEYLCALGGAQRPAYVPVVASGWIFYRYPVLFLLLIYEQCQCSHSSLYSQQSRYWTWWAYPDRRWVRVQVRNRLLCSLLYLNIYLVVVMPLILVSNFCIALVIQKPKIFLKLGPIPLLEPSVVLNANSTAQYCLHKKNWLLYARLKLGGHCTLCIGSLVISCVKN